jgi:hypothetical protein
MPAFKPKNNKMMIINAKSSTTLDTKHKNIIDDFIYKEETLLPKLKEMKDNLKLQLKHTKNIDIYLDLKDQIREIKTKIKNIRIAKKKYYLSNSKYVFDYYENKKISSEGNGKMSKVLNNFFNLDTNLIQTNQSASNVQLYLANVDDSFLDVNNFVIQTDICQHCYKGELIPIDHEGILVCNNCSLTTQFLVENEKSSYKEPHKEVCFYAYKRINHFREILAQFQAKEATQIPVEVIENIKQQMKKERIKNVQLTNRRAKEILKNLGYNKYYEHIPFIKDKLGIKPPVMSQELEERLCSLFMDIQTPYAKFCPDVRVNFLNYYYTIYKLCELLEQTEFLPFFPMLKDRSKRIEQDEIWKKICEELEWEFIPTI